jgi:ABC-type branched-subunit amino acid transport system substrate-binding protein
VRAANREGGQNVAVIHTDTRGNLEAFEAEAVRLAAVNRVAALLGGTTPEEIERLDRAGPVVVGLAGVRTRTLSDFVFLTGLAPAARGRALARQWADPLARAVAGLAAGPAPGPLGLTAALAGQRAAAARVAVLVDERRQEYGEAAAAFTRELAAGGVPPPAPHRYKLDADLDRLFLRLYNERPGAVLVAGPPEVVRRLRAVLPGLPVLFAGGEEQLPELQAHAETHGGIYLATAFVRDTDAPRVRAFVKEYEAAFHEEPGPAAALAYESAALLFQALERAGDAPGRDALRKQLKEMEDFPGLCGPLSFGPDQVLRRPAFVVRLDDGRPVTVRRCLP